MIEAALYGLAAARLCGRRGHRSAGVLINRQGRRMMKIQKVREHSHLFWNTRYCTHHMGVTLIEGGEWLVTDKGRCRRWICAMCDERRRERMAAEKNVA